MALPTQARLAEVYGADATRAAARLNALTERYAARFGAAADLTYYTAPGRTEIIGNHTDHNGGKILAASITMDTVAAAAPNGTNEVIIESEGYDPVVIDLTALEACPHCEGTRSLVAGMAVAARGLGYRVGGFNAVVSSEVIPSAGVSSSASFEMLVCSIIDHLFNGDAIPKPDYARIGQHAENVYWEKASGLMDQMACAVGGTILLDFSDGVQVEPVSFGFADLGCELVIVNTGRGHADLSAEYSAVPAEMGDVAHALGAERLCETTEDALLAELPRVRAEVHNDRAVLRAFHFFEECARVDEAVRALKAGDAARVLELIAASGNSSWKLLQNASVVTDHTEQPIPVALALTEVFLRRAGAGVCRLHGGGFAGVIMCVVPYSLADDYVAYIGRYMGAENVYRTNIRPWGACCLA